MQTVKLTRMLYTREGTKGILEIPDTTFLLYTMENPWLDNQREISCIPKGTYQCELVKSPRFGLVYEVKDVPGRSHILFHKGNSPDDTKGCILLGLTGNRRSKTMWVSNSAMAFEAFYETLKPKPFTLIVEDSTSVEKYLTAPSTAVTER